MSTVTITGVRKPMWERPGTAEADTLAVHSRPDLRVTQFTSARWGSALRLLSVLRLLSDRAAVEEPAAGS